MHAVRVSRASATISFFHSSFSLSFRTAKRGGCLLAYANDFMNERRTAIGLSRDTSTNRQVIALLFRVNFKFIFH